MIKILIFFINKRINRWRQSPKYFQDKIFKKIVKKLSKTQFGRDHNIIKTMKVIDFQKNVPLFDYEDLEKRYIPLLKEAQKNILWPGKMDCFCISSGTTSGEKLIPIYKNAIWEMVKTTFISAFAYMEESKEFGLFKRKIFHLYGLAKINYLNNIKYGYIGHISNSLVPQFLIRNKYPPLKINDQKSWQDKIQAITNDIRNQDLSVISGTPPWMNNLLEVFVAKYKSPFATFFPHLKLYIHGGCSFENYRNEFFRLIGPNNGIWTQEMYAASEGFIAFQDHWDKVDKTKQMDMLLNIGGNIFFEFLPFENGQYDKDKRLLVHELEVGKTYTLVITTIGSVIAYIIGDNIQVTTLSPLRVLFAGRAKQNVNLVNEHMDFRTINLIFNQLRAAMSYEFPDYILLPKIIEGHAYYHWYIELLENDSFSDDFCQRTLDQIHDLSCSSNPYYKNWSQAGVLKKLKLSFLKKDTMLKFLEEKKSVGQNKVPNVVLNGKAQHEFEQYLHTKDFLAQS